MKAFRRRHLRHLAGQLIGALWLNLMGARAPNTEIWPIYCRCNLINMVCFKPQAPFLLVDNYIQ